MSLNTCFGVVTSSFSPTLFSRILDTIKPTGCTKGYGNICSSQQWGRQAKQMKAHTLWNLQALAHTNGWWRKAWQFCIIIYICCLPQWGDMAEVNGCLCSMSRSKWPLVLNLVIYWNGKAVILTTLYSLAALEVVMVTTSSAANDYKVVNVSVYISISVSHGQSWYDTLQINAKVVNRSHIEMFGVRTSSTMTGTHVSGRVIKFDGFP